MPGTYRKNPTHPGSAEHTAAPDRIVLEGLKAYGYHGVFDFEKEQGQDFYIDLVIRGPLDQAAARDNLADTVDYGKLADVAVAVVTGERFNLIEKLAVVIAEKLLDYCHDVEVSVHKPAAPVAHEFQDVSVTVRRQRSAVTERTAAPPLAQQKDVWNSSGGTAVLSLGSNMGSPRDHITMALQQLGLHPRIKVLQRSGLYATAPVGGVDQDEFVNAAAIVDTRLSPHELLAVCQGIELAHGRVRDQRWGPRTLDIDIIRFAPYGTDIDAAQAEFHSTDPILTVPHKHAHERAFVLTPWQEMRPRAHLNTPTGVMPIACVLDGLKTQPVRKLD